MRPRISVTADPENSEFPFAALRSWITPVQQFYVRNHFPVPALDPATWRLAIGTGDGVPTLSLADLEALHQRSVVAALECAGNNRAFSPTPVRGVQWGPGAVSNGEWSGPSLLDVLAAAEAVPTDRVNARDWPVPGAHYHCTGADRGRPDGGDEVPYRRSLPRVKALDPDTLVALALNGEPLTAAHGAPARIVAPGWYGMASVKWLTRVEPAAAPAEDYYMTRDYTRRAMSGEQEPLDWIQPKAQLSRPEDGAVLAAGRPEIFGAAWAGAAPLAAVHVTTDHGANWAPAELEGPVSRFGWRLWRFGWEATAGRHLLGARATDAAG
ncbi:MAG: molybdopterin-dependent oxidoreductase, partial [Gemmatimonadota bacterium]